ncbi:iron-sulfur cluster assembly scaffold protein [Borreliella lusitaniae]|uniref:Iron-sulfur cluster assembly scaffold protein n=1 Tax=Borreliella lusitaniae TaxID=100177 RepID=A0ABZ0CMF4_9SPIR|nr:iron-sulfur cluster assembly scaffold protein [Borreliella lusitaniae]WKC85032.1 iron-sulfur cluster assembly scaffold protein [Borreliella lusitaniae]WNY68320.1 iron-sulfur cluster assembly scaffold protein [Borreliella lusitaniae]
MLTEKTKKKLIKLSKVNTYIINKVETNKNFKYQSKCGDQILFQIIEANNGKFNLKHHASGCIILLASANALNKLCNNKPKHEILNLVQKVINGDFTNLDEIDASLEIFNIFTNTNRKDCFLLPYKSLKDNLENYKPLKESY